jgi:hypothetical protein
LLSVLSILIRSFIAEYLNCIMLVRKLKASEEQDNGILFIFLSQINILSISYRIKN